MLKGQAKTDYQREYMRRKRAGLPTTTPKPPKPPKEPKEWQPSPRVIQMIEGWIRGPGYPRGIGWEVIKGLAPEPDEDGKIHMTDAIWEELIRRYKAITDQRRIEREQEKLEAAKPKPLRCSFCHEPKTSVRMLWGDVDRGHPLICDACITTAAAAIAQHRAGTIGEPTIASLATPTTVLC